MTADLFIHAIGRCPSCGHPNCPNPKIKENHPERGCSQWEPGGSPEVEPCECQQWARSVDLKYLTNHHPRCSHYNDSLIDVWKVSDGSTAYITTSEADAIQCKRNDEECGVTGLTITKTTMHREVFENLPEFAGF